jgi:hypothetical protein
MYTWQHITLPHQGVSDISLSYSKAYEDRQRNEHVIWLDFQGSLRSAKVCCPHLNALKLSSSWLLLPDQVLRSTVPLAQIS